MSDDGGRRGAPGGVSSGPHRLRVVLAEDSYLVREGVRRLLVDGGVDVDVVAEAASAPELERAARAHRPDAVLTDVRMPPGGGTDGIDAALRVRAELPGTGVVVLSQHVDASYARSLFRDGTAGLAYLLKERVGDREELVAALRAVAAGSSVVDPRVVDALVAGQRRGHGAQLDSLTPREREVLREMASGRTNAVIAQQLFLSGSAVSKHVASIFTKLGLVEDPATDRRVRAVLAWVTSCGPGAR